MAAAGEEEKQQVEARIEGALQSRLQYFKENDSSITMASVRRLLEEDLGFEKYALDVHKKFIKQFIEENLYCDDSGFKNSEENIGKHAGPSAGEEMESPKKHENDKELKGPTQKDEPNMEEDSPIMGLLTPKAETVDPQEIEISESTIKKAILERADHIKANSEALSMAEARRLLEEDLGLHKNALEPFKKFIRKQIEEVLEPPRVSKSATGRKKEGSRHCPSGEGRSRPKDRQNNEVEDTANMRGETMQSGEDEKSNRLKRCIIENEPDKSTKKSKIAKKQADENSEAENGASEDSGSQSPAEKPPKKKSISTPGYGKHVEHLKSVIKACGMSVPPSVYKKAKQVSDNKREYFLAKELEDILSKEGLSSNPTEKEIKEVRKRKDTAKELEGIDLSNIVTSSRRRSTSSFMAPPAHERKDGGRNNAKATKKDEKDRSSNSDKDIEDDGQKKDDKVKNSNSDKDSRDGSKKVEVDKEVVEEEEDDDDEEEDDDDDSESEEFNEGDDESD